MGPPAQAFFTLFGVSAYVGTNSVLERLQQLSKVAEDYFSPLVGSDSLSSPPGPDDPISGDLPVLERPCTHETKALNSI
jgi:hypothetical protein